MNRIVAALGVSQIIGYGTLYYAFALLVPPVSAAFGVTATLLFGIFSAGLLLGGLCAPLAGRLMDQHGAPWVMALGSLAAGAALILLALSPNIWVFGAGLIGIEVISVVVLYDAAFATLVGFGGGNARRAITRLTLIAGFASTLFWPLTDLLIGGVGWRGTYGVFAGLHFSVAFGLHLWIGRQTPAPVPVLVSPAQIMPDPLPKALALVAYPVVAVSFALTGALVSALGVHMVPVLAGIGMGAQATVVAMLVGPAQVAVRLVDTLFWRGLHPVSVAVISAAALPVAVGGLVLGLPVWIAAPLFALLFGVGQGLASIVRGSVPLVLFGADGYAERLGRLALIRTLISAGSPLVFALLHQRIGLTATLGLFLAVGFVAAAALIWLRRRLILAGALGPLR